MSYLYKRGPFFWISFRDRDGKRRNISTGLRHDVAVEVRKARALEAQRTADELARGVTVQRRGSSGWGWVVPWITLRYGHSLGTSRLYLNCWKPLSLFLHERKVGGPEMLTRQHCFDYIPWRTHLPPPAGCWEASHNTALNEVHILRIFMQEAVNRGIVDANPCVRLGVRKHRTERKQPLSAEHIALIRTEIARLKDGPVKHMLHVSFEVAIHQGCRRFETRLHLHDDINLERGTITFHTKTGKRHTTALHPNLVPLFKRLLSEQRVYTWDAPVGMVPGVWAGCHWTHFIAKINKREVKLPRTFHCTRVTVVTELARSGVSRTKAMAFVGHATSSIHEIYTALQPEDLQDCIAALRPGPLPEG